MYVKNVSEPENVLITQLYPQGHKKVAGLWAASGLQWTDFVRKNQVDQFLKDRVSNFAF